ncbi:MAG TPA: lysophospholipid acyltransferase family protein [Verrucomicrobiae bacterium]|nr:lysophospholipid acyltransferase family protein [Verrucomicrobiae bacterium]
MMAARLGYWWRAAATGFSFAVFGIASVLAGVTLFPLLCLTARDADVARRRAQALTHHWFGMFSRMMAVLGCIRYEIRGAERLRQRGVMIVANHPSLIDVVLLLGVLPEVDCIMKQAIFDNWFMRRPARWLGYIAQSTPDQLFTDAQAALQKQHSLLVFPEGTRTVPGRPIKMQHGAARMAVEAGATILPVAIQVTPPHLFKHQPWWRPPVRMPHYVLTVGEPYPTSRFVKEADGVPSVAARRLSRHWEQYFAAHTGGIAAHPLADMAGPPHYSRAERAS